MRTGSRIMRPPAPILRAGGAADHVSLLDSLAMNASMAASFVFVNEIPLRYLSFFPCECGSSQAHTMRPSHGMPLLPDPIVTETSLLISGCFDRRNCAPPTDRS